MPSAEPVCRECGAVLVSGQDCCWLCEARVQPAPALNPYAAPHALPAGPSAAKPLSTPFLIAMLVAVGVGLALLSPGLGLLLALVSVPALVRTLFVGQRKREAGQTFTTSQRIGAFALSCVLIYAVGWAGMIAFFTVCLGAGLAAFAIGGNENWVIPFALGGGALAAIPLTVWLLWLSRPRPIRLDTEPGKVAP